MHNCSLNIIEYSQFLQIQIRSANTYTFLLFNARICHLLTVTQCEVLYAPLLVTNNNNNNNLSTKIDSIDSYFRSFIQTMNHNECEKYSNTVRRKFILFIIGIILSVLVILLNTIVTLTILNSTKLRSLITNIFLLNLSIADFLSGFSFLYPCLMNILVEYAVVNYNSALLERLNDIRNNYYICLIAYAFIMSGMLMSVSILLSISIDKYIYIFKPYSYKKIITKRRCLLWISSLWFISILIGLLPLLGWNKMKTCSSSKQSLCVSNIICLIDRVFTTGYCSLFATISLLAAIVILYVYVRIFFVARDHLMRIERLRSQYASYEQPSTPTTAITLLTPNKINDGRDLQRCFTLPCSIIQRSNDGRERTGLFRVNIRRSLRALRTLLVLLVGFYLCWLPLLIYLLSHTWMDFKSNLIIHVLILIANVNSLVNPIVYAYRSKQFRIELWNGTIGRCCVNHQYRPHPSPAATVAAAIACKRAHLLPSIKSVI
ncbi:unnamed protein product [Rotaria magnacalcarata]|uniref:G-protein coupled receptors family 1 profile domain-containing protein n=3 Tax=Rotaria magnacalcarata TaxID=392030 RepID=A0A816M1W5_9BILA|nr:unnamed protein product [Rotaria magnacalcarata]CAF1985382.1 unnamed protein product [Rotaria magnacalcarata]CAF2029598.1 unnamed protein product [Rotaria magnacalcarata]CAF4179189.1 unnamed protein product [Rotaria magnacalcarata]